LNESEIIFKTSMIQMMHYDIFYEVFVSTMYYIVEFRTMYVYIPECTHTICLLGAFTVVHTIGF
jgi:hypothetical protein